MKIWTKYSFTYSYLFSLDSYHSPPAECKVFFINAKLFNNEQHYYLKKFPYFSDSAKEIMILSFAISKKFELKKFGKMCSESKTDWILCGRMSCRTDSFWKKSIKIFQWHISNLWLNIFLSFDRLNKFMLRFNKEKIEAFFLNPHRNQLQRFDVIEIDRYFSDTLTY